MSSKEINEIEHAILYMRMVATNLAKDLNQIASKHGMSARERELISAFLEKIAIDFEDKKHINSHAVYEKKFKDLIPKINKLTPENAMKLTNKLLETGLIDMFISKQFDSDIAIEKMKKFVDLVEDFIDNDFEN